MKKGTVAIMVCICFSALALLGAVSAAAKVELPDPVIKLYDPLFKKHRKPAVEFTHEKHVKDHKLQCVECHHIYKDGKNVFKEGDKVQLCSACHDFTKGKKGKMPNLKNAFHGNCKDCHKKLKKGPTKCKECHKK